MDVQKLSSTCYHRYQGIKANLQAFAHFLEAKSLESSQFDKRVDVLHDELVIHYTFWSLSQELKGNQLPEYRTTESGNGGSRTCIVSQAGLGLGSFRFANPIVLREDCINLS